MKFLFEKNIKIANELMFYLHKRGADDINLNMKKEKDHCIFIAWGKIKDIREEELTELINILNTERQHEIEEYYWNLLSESEEDSELAIVGMMIDQAEVEYKDDILK